MTDSLTSKTLHGLKWSYTGTFINSILQIGFAAIMARLLDPSDFGLMAMAGVILRFGTYFAQMGVGSAIIQKKEVSNEDIRASFTSSFLLGILFTVIAYLFAPLATYIFNNEKIVSIIRVMALSFYISGLSTTAVSLLRRNLAFRAIAIAEIFSYMVGYGLIGILLAYNGFGVWSLVVGALSQSTILAILAYFFCRHRLSFITRWKYYKPLYSFGSRVSLISFFEFVRSNLDTLAIAHFIGAGPLGLYNRAFMLVNLPAQYLTSSFSRVLFPSFSRVQEDPERLKKAYLSTIMLFSSILFPTCIGMAAASREIVLIVLGEKWVGAIAILQILAIATPLNLLSHFSGTLCEATSTLNIKLLIEIVFIVLLGSLFYLFSIYGILGFAVGVVVVAFVRFMSYVFIVKKICNISIVEFYHAYLPAFMSSILIGISLYYVSGIMRDYDISMYLLFITEIMIGLFFLVGFFFFGPHRLLREEVLNRLIHSDIITGGKSVSNRLIYWLYKSLLAN